ncbi:MAG: hypothetical protein ACRDDA_04430 [Aeromonas sp.]
MKLFICAILSSLFLSGCMSVKEIPGPNGEKMISVTCNGSMRDWGDCFEAVAESCGNSGYQVMQQNGEHVSSSNINVNNGIGWSNTGVNRNLMATCKR